MLRTSFFALRHRHALKSNGVIYSVARSYSSIEDFNKKKKTYSYGLDLDDLEKVHRADEAKVDLNSVLEGHPDLADLKPGSPEYKDRMYSLHQSLQNDQRKEQRKYESRERLKAVAIGFGAVVGLIAIHQAALNYEYLKNWLNHSRTYGKEVDTEKIMSLDDPSKNTNNMANLVSKFTDNLDTLNIISNLKSSEETPGLYLFGGVKARSKFPLRVPFFDDKLLKDVQLKDTLLVAINSKGNELYEMKIDLGKSSKNIKPPVVEKIKTPFIVKKCQLTANFIYLLSEKGETYFKVRNDVASKKKIELDGYSSRNWIGMSKKSTVFGKFPGKFEDISAGESHLLLLGKAGDLSVVSSSSSAANFGQLGLPKYSPYTQKSSNTNTSINGVDAPINTPLELIGLNYEIVSSPTGEKSTRPRVFSHIATGKFHNLASDLAGNVWTWGKNTYGECGSELSYRTDVQSIPQIAFTTKDFLNATKHFSPLQNSQLLDLWQVDGLYSGSETSYIKVNFDNSVDFLFSFGNGLKGQLGNNLYLHASPKLQTMKSLLGLKEFDEASNKTRSIGIKDVKLGENHGFIVLDNSGNHQDLLSFGDNEFGQLGNGKYVKNSKPNQIPKLIEPEELDKSKTDIADLKKELTKRILDVNNKRLQLVKDEKKRWQQSISAGDNCSAIYYKSI
ncbi:hypothetical protein CLIB1423_02S00606 [[Candida] railenensis]|uniref:Mitochondrial protein n=1 Tax=[Candida] railenensis TaxID=45579 RepID=A0A9P0QK46_9ASCO|nr:hypothetical protein CLIB1423_02S00606 [[Candida] railenensis]